MKSKYEIIDLTNNPDNLQIGDMVKLRKGLRIGRRYCDEGYENYDSRLTLYKQMRYNHYCTIKDIYSLEPVAKYAVTINVHDWGFTYLLSMLDLTCVKRRIEQ